MDIQYFSSLSFFNAAKQFFSDLQIPVNYFTEQPADLSEILSENYNPNNPGQSIVEDVYYIGLIDNNAFQNKQTGQKPENLTEDYEGIVIFGLTLDKKTDRLPTRTELGDIIRAFNREFPYTPVIIIFKYEEYITFANVERLKYKQPWRQGEKPGKVSMVKDINTQKVHTGHLKILKELEIKREGKDAVNTLKELYTYWQKVFSISILNETFYKELFEWYEWAINKVQFPSEPQKKEYGSENDYNEALQTHRATNVIRLLTRVIFSWFMKEKNQLIPDALFDKNYLDGILTNDDFSGSNYYKAILQNLFFATLNQEMNTPDKPDNRKFAVNDGFTANKNQYGVKNLYRYQHLFKIKESEVVAIFNAIPFLNGGLFDCLDKEDENKKVVYIDGFSRNPKMQPVVPDELFWGAVSNKGLIEILESYKFTIAENTPVEEEVALDPELLGKVFENLLASYNPETKTTARKKTGSYYTPREIVNYMVDESLVAYFENTIIDALEKGNPDFKVFIPKPQKDLFGKSQPTQGKLVSEKIVISEEQRTELNKKLHTLISYESHENPFTDNKEVNLLLNAIDNIKILDPACGSGAFPMGVLQKLVYVLGKLDPENQHWKEQQEKRAEKEKEEKIKKLETDIETVQNLSQEEVKKMAIEELEKRKEEIRHAKEHNDPDYLRKLYLIRNCIYGVDIQPIAVQISKLRFFISLLIEQNINESLSNNGIQALPNLETKFVAANSLIGLKNPLQQSLKNLKVEALEDELKTIREQHFNPHTRAEKIRLQNLDKQIREKIKDELIASQWESKVAEKLAKWDIYNQNSSADFFDIEWMFGLKYKFDVIIGNPPYVRADNPAIAEQREVILKSGQYETLWEKWDLMVPFFEKGLKMLNTNGILTYIASNSITTSKYAEKLHDWVIKNHFVRSIDYFENITIFDAGVIPVVALIQCNVKNRFTRKVYRIDSFENVAIKSIDNHDAINLKEKVFRKSFSNVFYPDIKADLLGNVCYMSKGMVTNSDEKTAKGEFVKNDLVSDIKSKTNCKEYIEGKNLEAYKIEKIRYIEYNTDRVPNKLSRPTFRDLYNGEKILRGRVTKGTYDNTGIVCNDSIVVFKRFYDLRNVNERSISVSISKNNFDKKGSKTSAMVKRRRQELEKVSQKYNLKYILAVINSNYAMAYLNNFRRHRLENYFYPDDFRKFPLPDISENNQTPFVILADYMLHLRNSENPEVIDSVPNEHLAQFFESVINGCVYELYFEEHMKEKEIDILQFVQADVVPIEGKTDTEKAGIIKEVYEKWREHKSPVRNRLLLFASRSEIISKIEDAG